MSNVATESDLDIEAIFAAANARSQDDEDPLQDIGLLVACVDLYNKTHHFKPKDLITWKPHMRNRRYPSEGHPCVFVRWLDQPVISEIRRSSKSSTLLGLERADMEYGIADADGDFIVFVADSRRMMPWIESNE